jgi:capsular polysaccharide biosynthesis protein
VNEADKTAALSVSGRDDDLAGQLWNFDEFGPDEDHVAADLATGLTSAAFIRAALRRSARLLCILGAVGFLAGAGVFVARPPAYQASATVLLTTNPDEQPSNAMLDNQAIGQSDTIAGRALGLLRLKENAASFAKDYMVTAVTGRVLEFTARATSSAAAVQQANALAKAFLGFQATLLEAQGRAVNASLQRQISQAQQRLSALDAEISQVRAEPASDARRDKLENLASIRAGESNALNVFKQSDLGNQASTRITTSTIVQGSRVLDAARPIPESRAKLMITYVATGLIVGLALGAGIVVIRALVSDRLRRRDDIVRALGAPVRLSVGRIRADRWQLARRGLDAGKWGRNVARVVSHLDRFAPARSRGSAALAVVPTDDPGVAALAMVSLAASRAERGMRVAVADLWPGAPAARLLNAAKPGVHRVSAAGAELVVLVPDQHDIAPSGPFARPRRSPPTPEAEPLAAAAAQADLLLTLAHLDPAVGGDHLPGWAPTAVAVVTAGRSSATRIHAVGEMIRLAGAELVSAVLIGADKTDESIGTAPGHVLAGGRIR